MEINAFMIISAALVFFMTPGLAFFYGGMVRRKNILNTMFMSFVMCGISSVLWVIIGYSMSFGGDICGFIGGFNNLFFKGVGLTPNELYASTIPEVVFAAFQMMFSIITPALFTGSLIGRVRFKAVVIFVVFWLLLVYYPLAHMVWGTGGFIDGLGALDFAGGNVVHISSGVTGLVLCMVLGKRKGHGLISYKPHNIPFVLLGAIILWFGWFGFNAGSALAADGLAAHAFMTTNTSAAIAMLSWMVVEKIKAGKPTLMGAATGAVLGLVAITPGAGFVPIWSSFIIGALVSPICYYGVILIKKKLKIDDALDAFGCHGIGGIWGGIATGIFGKSSINPVAKWDGLVYGEWRLFVAQIEGILITIVIAVVGTLICVAIVRIFTTLRVTDREERIGLDISQHGENAYPSFNGMDQ